MILSKTSGYVKIFNVKNGDKDKSNKIMYFGIDDDEVLEKYITICTKIEDLKAKIRTYGDKVYTNFRCLHVPEDGVKCESFTIISIDSLLVYENKYYL